MLRSILIFCLFFTSITISAQNLTLTAGQSQSLLSTGHPKSLDQLAVPVEVIDPFTFSSPLLESLNLHSHATVVQSGGAHKSSQIFVRGSASEHTHVMVEGIEINDPINPTRGTDLSTLDIEEFRNIEVIPTAYSVLYGSDALGGVVNFSTPKPYRTTPETTLQVNLGSYNFWRGMVAHRRENIAVQAVYSADKGFSARAPATDEADGHEYTSLTLQARQELGPVKVHYFGRNYFLENEIDNGTGPNDDDPNHIARNLGSMHKFSFVANPYSQWQTTFDLTYAYSQRKLKNLPDPDHVDQSSKSQFYSQIAKAKWLNHLQLFKVHHLTTKLNIGAEYEWEYGKSQMNDSNFGQSAFASEDQRTTSLFTLLELLSLKYSAYLGYRSDFNSVFSHQKTYSLGLNYFIFTNPMTARVFVNTSSGFKSPSLFQLFSSFGSEDLKPETSLNHSIGFSIKSTTKDIVFTSHYFENRFRNLIDFDFATSKYTNQSKSKVRGWELSLQQVYRQMQLKAMYTRLLTEDAADQQLLRRPAHKSSAHLSWHMTPLWSTTLALQHFGRREDVDFQGQRCTLPSYVLSHFSLHYKPQTSLEGYLRLHNILDKDYQSIKGFAAAGRTVMLGMRLKI